MPCGWEGNRRSGVALAMRHRLQWFMQAHGLRKGDEHLAYTPHGAWHTLPILAKHCNIFQQSQPELVHFRCTVFCLQCFDAVGWAAKRASGL